MGNNLTEIAQQLIGDDKKVQLIYAFNGTGKTRLSREFKMLVESKTTNDIEADEMDVVDNKIIYYNAFTEDLFHWNNDDEPRMKIQPNSFTKWILEDQGKENEVAKNFQKYSSSLLTPKFNADFSEVSFLLERGNDENIANTKISKGEESNFVWCIFYVLLEEFLEELGESTDSLENSKKYIFIDDPVTSLDDNHLIQLAVDLAQLIKKSSQYNVEFVITTHNPLFYNILSNEFARTDKVTGYKKNHCKKYRLNKFEDGTFTLEEQESDSPFSYHLFLKTEIEKAIEEDNLQKYHFNYIRNILEKTATFLGYKNSVDLFPKIDGNPDPFVNRIINVSSHSKHSGEEVSELSINEKEELKRIFNHLLENYKFGKGV